MNIFNNNTISIKSSSVYIAFLILKSLESTANKRMTIYKISEILEKEGINHSRNLTLGLTFLYSIGVVNFEEPYVWIE